MGKIMKKKTNLCYAGDIIIHAGKEMEVAQVISKGNEDHYTKNKHFQSGCKSTISAYPIMTDNGQVLRRSPRYLGEDWMLVKKANNSKVWSIKHASCIVCGTTERKHSGHGMCGRCYKRAL